MPFWKCYFHVIWTTFGRAPLITPEIERIIIETIRRKSAAMDCSILAINTVSDHIHIAVSIPPKVAVAEWVRSTKGLSTHEINAIFPDLNTHFQWQNSYGILTFGAKNLAFVCAYIENQKTHHLNQAIEPYLEQVDDD